MTAMPVTPVLVAGLVLVASCADWPDELDPSDWYGSVVGEDAAPASSEPLPGSEDDYPRLSDVPEAPEDVSTREEIDRIAESLEADRVDAERAGDAVRADDGTAPGDGAAVDPDMSATDPAMNAVVVQSLVALSERDAAGVPVMAAERADAVDPGSSEPVRAVDAAMEDLEPAGQVSGMAPAASAPDVPAVPHDEPTFDEMFGASGPTTAVQALDAAALAGPTDAAIAAAFTAVGEAPGAETLVAVLRFGHGSSTLGAGEREIVAKLAVAHARMGGLIRLVGHASRGAGALTGADRALVNFKVSLDRATAVADELIRNGTPRDAILIEAAADGSSMAAAAGVEDEAIDRRVEVFFGA